MKELSRFWTLLGFPKVPNQPANARVDPETVKYYLLRDFDVDGWMRVYGDNGEVPPGFGCYGDIDERHINFLRPYINEDMDLERYKYYVELEGDYGGGTVGPFDNE